MKTISRDTDASAEKVLIQRLRQTPVYRRLEIVNSLVKTTRRLSWLAIRERYAEETLPALTRRFLSLLYPDLARSEELEKILRELFFSSPEDIILRKLVWYDSGGRISERQWSDVLGVFKVQSENLDHAYLELWATKLGVSDLLEKAFKDSGVEKK